MSLTIQYGQPISFVGGAEGTTTASLPAHAKDDVILAFSYRNGSLTPPTLPSGWTSIATESHEDGGSQASARVAYRVSDAALGVGHAFLLLARPPHAAFM